MYLIAVVSCDRRMLENNLKVPQGEVLLHLDAGEAPVMLLEIGKVSFHTP